MYLRKILGLSAAVTLGFVLLHGSAFGQQKSLKSQLIGTWAFVSATDTNKDGTKSDRWGPNPKGSIIFEANGRYSFMISRSDIPKFAANNVNQGTDAENKAVVKGVIANIGTWSVDEATKTLTTTIEAGTFPNLNGSSQKRIVSSINANEFKYTNPATTTGAVTEAVWKRVK
jgi:hypothetical protein